MNRQRNDRSPLHLSDEELEYYGDLYIEWKIGNVGVDFETFLSNPDDYLRKHSQGRWPGRRDDDGAGRKGLLRYVRPRHAARTSSS